MSHDTDDQFIGEVIAWLHREDHVPSRAAVALPSVACKRYCIGGLLEAWSWVEVFSHGDMWNSRGDELLVRSYGRPLTCGCTVGRAFIHPECEDWVSEALLPTVDPSFPNGCDPSWNARWRKRHGV